jgi:hypothetical protein
MPLTMLNVMIGGLYYHTGLTIAGFQARIGCLFFMVRSYGLIVQTRYKTGFRGLSLHSHPSAHSIISLRYDLSSFVRGQTGITGLSISSR